MKQSEIIKQMTDKQINEALILSQLFFLVISIFTSIFLFDKLTDWSFYFTLDMKQIIYYGVLPGLIIVLIDVILISILPKHFLDDGGMNERIFKNRTIPSMILICLIIAISEELLFRGVLQTTIGYIYASVIFALVHFRYIRKPILFMSVILCSFYIGYLFELTGNLFVTITTHFIINFLLGLLIRYQK